MSQSTLKFRQIFAHKVAANSSALYVNQFVNIIAPILILIILTRRLGLESYSLFAYVLVTTRIINVVTDYGFNITAMQRIAQAKTHTKVINANLGSVILGRSALTVISLLALFLLTNLTESLKHLRDFFPAAALLIVANGLSTAWLFQALQKAKHHATILVTTKILLVALTFALVQEASDLNTAVLITGLSGLIANIWGFWRIHQLGFQPKFFSNHASLLIRESAPAFYSRLSAMTYTTANAFYLGFFERIESVGIFNLAQQLYQALQSLFQPIIQAIYPYMAEQRDYRIFRIALVIMLAGAAIILPIAYFAAPTAIALISGGGFTETILPFTVMLAVVPINLIGSSFGYPFFVGLNKNHVANRTIHLGAIVHILALGFLIFTNRLNALNLSLALLMSESIVMIARLYFARVHFRPKLGNA